MNDQHAQNFRRRLSTLIDRVVAGAKDAKHDFREFVASAAHVPPGTVAVASAVGGTKQMRNRLGQDEVSAATEFTLLHLDHQRHLEPCVNYTVESALGHRASAPVGPLGFAVKHGDTWTVDAIVEARATSTSRLIQEAYETRVIKPFEAEEPSLPGGIGLWLLRSKANSKYGDIDGVRYHFPTHIPNSRQLQQGDVAAVDRAGQVIGIGHIGSRVPAEQGHALVYYDRYQEADSNVDLATFGDPRTNMNSIWAVERAWMLRLMKELGISILEQFPATNLDEFDAREADDSRTPFMALTYEMIDEELSSRKLFFEPDVVYHALAALRSGKHVMLTGAPGTGKTSLAHAIAAAAAACGLSEEPLLTTATSDWTVADTVGAYRLMRDGQLRFHPGQVVTAIEGNRWLIIDELNRSDIDKAIGQLFTVLSGQAVVLPFDEPSDGGELPISIAPPQQPAPSGTSSRVIDENWRLIATLNDRDQDLLFDMSEALMRRFAVVEVRVPAPAVWRRILEAVGSTGNARWDAALLYLVTSKVLEQRPVGAAVILDCVRHLQEVTRLGDEIPHATEASLLQSALDLYVRPQLRTVMTKLDLNAGDLLTSATSLASHNAAVNKSVTDGDVDLES